MHFQAGRDVQFQLQGKTLTVRLEASIWRMSWAGKTAEHEHIDNALAQLLGQPTGAVIPLVVRLLRATPGSNLDD
jgi:hypothetical protein